jgi:hypothetical protein
MNEAGRGCLTPFFFVVLEFELRGFVLTEPRLQFNLLWLFLRWGFSDYFPGAGLKQKFSPISASQVARIIDVSHWHWLPGTFAAMSSHKAEHLMRVSSVYFPSVSRKRLLSECMTPPPGSPYCPRSHLKRHIHVCMYLVRTGPALRPPQLCQYAQGQLSDHVCDPNPSTCHIIDAVMAEAWCLEQER